MSAIVLRALNPMSGPRLSAAMPLAGVVAQASAFAWLPVHIACAAIAAYAETHKAVLRLV